jgi:hypothetical protein
LQRSKKTATRNGFVSEGGPDRSKPVHRCEEIAAVSAGRHPCSTAWHESPLVKNREPLAEFSFRVFREAGKPRRKNLFYLYQPRSNPRL